MVLFLASMIEDNETLRKTDETVQSKNLERFRGEVIQQDYHMPDVITVRVQTSKCWFCTCIDTYITVV